MLKRILKWKLFLGLILGGVSIIYAQTTTVIVNPDQTTTIIVQLNPTLSLTVPASITYTLTSPLTVGSETIASSQQIIVEGDNFNNTTTQPYVTVSMTGVVTNADLKVTSISITTTGTVTANPTTPDITLSATAQGYAAPNVNQSAATGTITGTHNLIIEKLNKIPAGSYSLTLNWTASDGA